MCSGAGFLVFGHLWPKVFPSEMLARDSIEAEVGGEAIKWPDEKQNVIITM